MRRFLSFALAAALAVLGLSIFTPVASADTPCDTAIYDGTSARVLGDTTPIVHTAKRMRDKQNSIGADVHVVVVDGLPLGSLDAYKNSLLTQCSSWGGNGSMKHNLLVVMVSMQRKSALYYGNDYRAALDDDAETIRDSMGSWFRNEDFRGGITVGLRDAEQTVLNYVPAQQPTTQPQPPHQPQPSTPRPSYHLTINWGAVGKTAGAVALVALAVVFFWLRRRRNEARDELEAKRTEVSSKIQELDTLISDGNFDVRVQILGLQIEDEDNTDLKQLETNLVNSRAAAYEEFDRLEKLMPIKSWFASGFTSPLDEYIDVLSLIENGRQASKAYEQFVASMEREIAGAAATYEALKDLPRTHRNRLEELQTEGFKFDGVDVLIEKLVSLLTTANSEITRGRAGLALDELRAIPPLSQEISKILEAGSLSRKKVVQNCEELTVKLDKLRGDIREAKGLSKQIAKAYGNRAVADLVSEQSLQDGVKTAESLLANAQQDGDMEHQLWEKALGTLEMCSDTITTHSNNARAIKDTEKRMAALRSNLANSIRSAIREAKAAREAINERRGAQDSYATTVKNCEEALDALDPDLPELLDVQDTYTRIARDIDEAISSSKRVHQAILDEERRERERIEREAREARERAEREAREARERAERAEREAREERDRQAAATAALWAAASTPSYDPPSYSPPADTGGGASGGW